MMFLAGRLRALLISSSFGLAVLAIGVLAAFASQGDGRGPVMLAEAKERKHEHRQLIAKALRAASSETPLGVSLEQPPDSKSFALRVADKKESAAATGDAGVQASPEPAGSPEPQGSPEPAAPEEPADAQPGEQETEKEAATPVPAAPEKPVKKTDVSLMDGNTLVTAYGTPLAPGLGVLGKYEPEELVRRLKSQARAYDRLNGDEKGAVPVIELIYSIVQSEQTANGLYLYYTDDKIVNRYIELAERHDLQIVLDLQIGRGNVVEEVKKIERFLRNPRVHVAVDPEYAVGPNGIPIQTPGRISGHEINQIQEYLNGVVESHDLPRKMFVIHQFMDHTITDVEATRPFESVDLVLNMDAFGDYPAKVKKYRQYAHLPHAQKRSFNIFLKQDQPVASAEEVMKLDPIPDMVMYQ